MMNRPPARESGMLEYYSAGKAGPSNFAQQATSGRRVSHLGSEPTVTFRLQAEELCRRRIRMEFKVTMQKEQVISDYISQP